MSDTRAEREASFHDELYGDGGRSRDPVTKYYSVNDRSNSFYRSKIAENCKGKRILEYGCGVLADAFTLAKLGADVTCIDISQKAIDLCADKAEREGLNISFGKMNAEALTFEDHSFDSICGIGILHHLDLDLALGELRRTLKPGGQAIFMEPLGHNPLINAYRALTPSMRTPDEHPILMKDIADARAYFDTVEADYFSLTTLAAVPFRSTPIFNTILSGLNRVDEIVNSVAPFLNRYSWVVVLTYTAK